MPNDGLKPTTNDHRESLALISGPAVRPWSSCAQPPLRSSRSRTPLCILLGRSRHKGSTNQRPHPTSCSGLRSFRFFCTIAPTLRSSTQPLAVKSRGYILALGGAEINMAAPRQKSDEATELPPPARMLAESACSTSQSPRRTRQTALVSCHGWSAKLKPSLPALRLYVFANHP